MISKILVHLSVVLLAVGCATTAPSNLVVQVDPIEQIERVPAAPLAEVFVEDERTQESAWSERKALGVSMGTISYEPYETELVQSTLEARLTTLLEKRGFQSKQYYLSELIEFNVNTDSTALYWDIIGKVRVRLKLRDQTLELYGTNTERTYAWPGEEIIERVVQNSLAQMVTELGNAVQALPSEELAGFSERPSDWAEAKTEQARLVELRLPAGSELPDDQALIYFYRPSRAAGSANAYKITVNDRHVANVLDGGRFPYVCEPGEVQIRAETVPNMFNFGLGLAMMSKKKMNVTLEPGEVYFIDIGVDSTGGPKLIPAGRDEGLEGVKKTKLMKAIEGSS